MMEVVEDNKIESVRELLDPEALILDGLDDAAVGRSDCGKVVYDYDKMISIFEGQGMSVKDAVEWIDFNVLGVQCNGAGFIVLYSF
jgi:hypothetical protein